MPQPMSSLSINFAQPWTVLLPKLYRYLDQTFVDEFFASGKLRISSFDAFSKHTDEARLDGGEGLAVVTQMNTNATGFIVVSGVIQGHDAYVLCASTRQSENISAEFGHRCGIHIHNPRAFALVVGRHLPGFYKGIEGDCEYVPKRLVRRENDRLGVDAFLKTPNKTIEDVIQLSMGDAGDELMFLKPERYAPQNEYRLLWRTTAQVTGFIDIVCPEAREYCTPFVIASAA